MSTKMMLDKLIQAAKDPNDEIAVRTLLDEMDKFDPALLKEASADFDELCESWEEGVTRSDDKANICVRLAELSVVSSEGFRASLHAAIRKLLPPYLASSAVIKAIGARDENTSVRDAAMRLRKLQHLRSTALVYQHETRQWGKIHGIDKVTGTIAISGLQGGSVSSVPIASAIFTLHFFNTTPEMVNLLYPATGALKPASEYRRIFQLTTLSELYEQKMKEIIQRMLVPELMTADAFEQWWQQEDKATTSKSTERPYWCARSILELYTLLQPEKENPQLTAEAAEGLTKLFGRIRKDMQAKDVNMLTESVAILSGAADAETLKAMYAPLRGKAPFWPADTADFKLESLEPWGKLSVKLLPGLVKATELLYTQEEIAQMGIHMPLKCIATVFSALPEETVQATILAQKELSCDMILWIFRSKASLPKKISSSIDMATVMTALSVEKLPKEWSAALRDLKKALFDKADFQKYLIDNADGDIPSIIAALQRFRNFNPGERQSIMVKLSRHSDELKNYLESGAGSKMMGADAQKTEQLQITSLASHKRISDELENIVTVQIPENNAAVALARSFGDLRENAEYDAAKERRRYLHRRRAELERALESIQPTGFKDVEVREHAVVGSVVTLQGEGKEIVYYLLGALDGNPDKNYISYMTPIGKALLDRKVGETVEIPAGGKYTLKSVAALPEDLRKQLANEE